MNVFESCAELVSSWDVNMNVAETEIEWNLLNTRSVDRRLSERDK